MIRHTFLLAALGGCQLEAPERPSFQQDVMPILAANCVRCHGYPALGGSPPGMRLDVYGDIAIDDTTTISGAASLAGAIASRVTSETQPMPPRFPIDDYQIETLRNWANSTSPDGLAPRGDPRPNNRPPQITVHRLGQVDHVVALNSAIHDDDSDLVAGELRVGINGGDRIVGPVRSGLVEVHWNAIGVAPGDYPLSAHLDDGGQVHIIPLGTIAVGGP